jgi:DnaJ-class molecular chaperone
VYRPETDFGHHCTFMALTTWSQPQPVSSDINPSLPLRAAIMSGSSATCLYKVLGVSLNATASELMAAHRNLAPLSHSDRLTNRFDIEKAEGETKMKAINHANDILSDPAKRAVRREVSSR